MEIGYEENKGSAMVGALSSMVAAHYGYDKIGVVLGDRDSVCTSLRPAIDTACTGVTQGYAEKPARNQMSDCTGPARAPSAISRKEKPRQKPCWRRGAGIIYNVAGPLGIGDLEAITEHLEAKNKSAVAVHDWRRRKPGLPRGRSPGARRHDEAR